MTNTDATMRAMCQDVLGGPEVLQEVRIPRPQPGPGEILVGVRAAGVNPTDWKHRATGRFLGEPPFVLGWDVSGVVEEVGFGVTLFQPGDEVFGMLPYPHGAGSYAEYVLGPTRAFARKPKNVDHTQAAAVPLAALTAWQALVDTAGLAPAREDTAQRVLVHAAAGGVGHLAVQIAKARGAYVVGTASGGKHEFVRGVGADEVVDYREVDFTEIVDDIDVVLDPISGEYSQRSLRTLRRGGVLVSILPIAPETTAEAERRGMRAEAMLVEHDHAGMNAVADLVESGALRAEIAAAFPLSRAAEAHTLGETGRTAGKIVLTMD